MAENVSGGSRSRGRVAAGLHAVRLDAVRGLG